MRRAGGARTAVVVVLAMAGLGAGAVSPSAAVTGQAVERSWTTSAEYNDVCDDGGRLDVRAASIAHDTHGWFGASLTFCEPWTPADLDTVTWRMTGDTGTLTVTVTASGDDLVVGGGPRGFAMLSSDGRRLDVVVGDGTPTTGDPSVEFAVEVRDATSASDDVGPFAWPSPCTVVTQRHAVVRTEPGEHDRARASIEEAGHRVELDLPRIGALRVALSQASTRGRQPAQAADLTGLPGVAAAQPPATYAHQDLPTRTAPWAARADQSAFDRIGAADAWRAAPGSGGALVAIIDDGVDGGRPAFGDRVLEGLDTTGSPVTLPAGANSDLAGHGTAVAGLVAADPSLDVGLAGVDPTARVLPYRVFDGAGCADDAGLAAAVLDAVDRGAQVINLSLGSDVDASVLRDAVREATDQGIVVVASAGNGHAGGNLPSYPAVWPEVIAVGASTSTDERAPFSIVGPEVEVVAPGGGAGSDGVLVLGPGDGTMTARGTSFSAPLVAGSAALWLGSGNGTRDAAGFRAALRDSADDLELPGRDPFTGSGVLDLPGLGLDGRRVGVIAPVALDLGGATGVALATGDVDGDGHVDLVLADEAGDAVVVATNDGAGGFTTQAPVPVGAAPTDVAVGDVDGDGDLDVVTIAAGAPEATRLALLRNDGAGAFTVEHVALDQVPGAVAVDRGGAAADLAVVTFPAADQVRTFTDTGAGLVQQDLVNLAVGSAPGPVDVRGGVIGVATTGASSITVLAPSTGGLEATLLATTGPPTAVALTAADVVHVTTEQGLSSFVSTADGWGRAPRTMDVDLAGATGLHATDLDRDGVADLVATVAAAPGLALQVSLGQGRTLPAGTVPYGAGANVVDGGATDLDADGLPDVLTLHEGAVEVAWGRDVRAPRITATPAPDTRHAGSVEVTLVAADDTDPAPVLHYTADGSTPSTSSPVFTAPLNLDETTTLRYVAVDAAGNVSPPRIATWFVDPPSVALQVTARPQELAPASFALTSAPPAARWVFGDGASATTLSGSHAWEQEGPYRVVAVAQDGPSWTAGTTIVHVEDGAISMRFGGTSRIDTAVVVSRAGWSSATDAVLVTARDFPDALAAGALAAMLDAPVLLTRPDALPDVVAAELARLRPGRVWIVGGDGAVSEPVAEQLRRDGFAVERVSGKDRYQTAGAVAAAVGASPYGEAVIALGNRFPDAVSAAALSASPDRLPVLLTRQDTLPTATRAALTSLGVTRVFIVGGTAAVSASVEQELVARGYVVTRLAGGDRYATSRAVLAEARLRFSFTSPGLTVVTGAAFPDALSGGGLAARVGSPLLLLPPDDVEARASASLDALRSDARRLDRLLVIGGTSALSETVEGQVRAALVE